ncbi:hypothetical protein JXC34_04720 [Candidatus Woesearchaeota archaeon]|nr:hypothetical protein [Candidatus Woesearchaeota archaeon]
MMELGGNIELVGFNDIDSSELIVLKKIIGNFARKFSDQLQEDYEKLTLTLKKIHGEKSSKFEVQAKIMTKSKPINSECTQNNLFFCVAEVLKKLEAQIGKK